MKRILLSQIALMTISLVGCSDEDATEYPSEDYNSWPFETIKTMGENRFCFRNHFERHEPMAFLGHSAIDTLNFESVGFNKAAITNDSTYSYVCDKQVVFSVVQSDSCSFVIDLSNAKDAMPLFRTYILEFEEVTTKQQYTIGFTYKDGIWVPSGYVFDEDDYSEKELEERFSYGSMSNDSIIAWNKLHGNL